MNSKLVLVLVLVAAVNGNPFAKNPKNLIHRQATVSPNIKAVSFEKIAKSAVAPLPQKPIPSPKVKVENCGLAPLAVDKDTKIVGGTEASPHSYPWQVALYIDDIYFCGGSIISDEWIMSAGHCMDGARTVDVVAGAHDLTVNEPSQVTLTSSRFTVHSGFSESNLHDDISVIQLPEPLDFNDYIQPVCLPTGADIGAGVTVTATGWGKTKDGILVGISDTLNEVDVITDPQNVCSDYYGNRYFTEDMICIDTAGDHGTCNGDSGGPLNYNGDQDGVETRGIVSYGSSAGCESGAPDSFTRVSHYLDWIEENTGVTV